MFIVRRYCQRPSSLTTCQILFPPIFFSVFQVVSGSVKIVDVILLSSILAARPACQNILDFVALAILLRGELYKSESFALYNIIHYTFHFCKIQIFSLAPSIFKTVSIHIIPLE